ncbi:hypothetical protein FBZ98_10428 [Rhizobium sp. ERR 922]|nr:hypothetical protein FBZ98_10428 [Rhizobium sp. ERR 922]TWB95933.1 hypothetical protein FBZ97_104622 [Rhizobium sp. ERR 942]
MVRDDDHAIRGLNQLLNTLLGLTGPVRTLKVERLGDDCDGEDAGLTRRMGNNWGGTSPRTSSHVRRQETHLSIGQVFHNLPDRLLGCGSAEVRQGTRAQTFRGFRAKLDNVLGS